MYQGYHPVVTGSQKYYRSLQRPNQRFDLAFYISDIQLLSGLAQEQTLKVVDIILIKARAVYPIKVFRS